MLFLLGDTLIPHIPETPVRVNGRLLKAVGSRDRENYSAL